MADVRRAILLTLAAMPTTACWTGQNCGLQDPEAFQIDVPLTADDVAWLAEASAAGDDEDIGCVDACVTFLSWDDIDVLSVDDCTLEVDEALLASSNGDTSSAPVDVGRLTCSGVGQETTWCKGRRPLHRRDAPATGPTPLASHLARCAQLEAAAVDAFVELEAQLRELGAPRSFITRCRRAAEDERMHARLFARLARVRGATVHTTPFEPAPASLLEIALHNAVEGCVNETWAALEAAWQARHAAPSLRPLFARLAQDETEHAQLAWDLHRWFLGRLSAQERALLTEAQREAFAGLAARAGGHGPGLESLGLPADGDARGLATVFATALAA